MTTPTERHTNTKLPGDLDRLAIRPLGENLASSLGALIEAIPGAPHTPSPLARRLEISRVIVSKLLNAIARKDPYEVLQHVPGPESLRTVTIAARRLGVGNAVVDRASESIEQFATLIRRDFGTRGALNAAISPQHPDLHRRFEHASRYQVHKGMTEILGVEAETWLTSMFFAPSRDDDQYVEVTTIHGALAMRRLRADVNVHFSFGAPHQIHVHSDAPGVPSKPADLRQYYTNDPAPLETFNLGGQLIHRLAQADLGKRSIVDMLAVSHNPKASPRYASPERRLGGVIVFPDVPVKTLICDALVHDSIFPDTQPELVVYNPGGRGPANPNDARRDIDRVKVPETVEHHFKAADRFEIPEVPRYAEMAERVCAVNRRQLSEFRLHRVRMLYPIHGFQIVMAFEAPPKP